MAFAEGDRVRLRIAGTALYASATASGLVMTAPDESSKPHCASVFTVGKPPAGVSGTTSPSPAPGVAGCAVQSPWFSLVTDVGNSLQALFVSETGSSPYSTDIFSIVAGDPSGQPIAFSTIALDAAQDGVSGDAAVMILGEHDSDLKGICGMNGQLRPVLYNPPCCGELSGTDGCARSMICDTFTGYCRGREVGDPVAASGTPNVSSTCAARVLDKSSGAWPFDGSFCTIASDERRFPVCQSRQIVVLERIGADVVCSKPTDVPAGAPPDEPTKPSGAPTTEPTILWACGGLSILALAGLGLWHLRSRA
jgi:hypothetical protein